MLVGATDQIISVVGPSVVVVYMSIHLYTRVL